MADRFITSFGKSSARTITPPYPLYFSQVEYIQDIQEHSIDQGAVCILEAPTGFGKTISNLLAILPMNKPIYYFFRTHSQAAQVLEEIEQLNRHNDDLELNAIHIAGKAHMCLFPEVAEAKEEEERQLLCKINKNKELRPCVAKIKEDTLNDYVLPAVITIDEMIRLGKELNICPKKISNHLCGFVNIVAAPYIYLLISQLNPAIGYSGNGKEIVIFDEAHNVDGQVLEFHSLTLKETDIENLENEFRAVERELAAEAKEKSGFDAYTAPPQAPKAFDKAFRCITEFHGKAQGIANRIKDNSFIPLRLFREEIKNAYGNDEAAVQQILKALRYLEGHIEEILKEGQQTRYKFSVYSVHRTINFLEHIYAPKVETDYVLVKSKKKKKARWHFRSQYLNPIDILHEVNSRNQATLYSSGTLTPLVDTQVLLGVPDSFAKSYPNPFPKERIFGVHIPFYKKDPLTSKFDARNHRTYRAFSEAIRQIARIVPRSLLVFFPSYKLVEEIYPDLSSLVTIGGKQVFSPIMEQKKAESLPKYTEFITKGGDGILISAFRGRESEGFNYPDELARGIIVAGIPYPDTKDPVVKARKGWFDVRKPGTGWRWYESQAFRAVSQALGRGWRHPKDYCCVFLLEKRFVRSQGKISHWISEQIDWDTRSFQEKLELAETFYAKMASSN